MIQRIQSVFLLVVAALMIVCLFVPIWEKVNEISGEKVVLNAFSLTHYSLKVKPNDLTFNENVKYKVNIKNTPLINVNALISALIAFYSIFKFKKRPLQLKLGMFNTVLISGVLGLMFYYQNAANNMFDTETYGQFKIGLFLPPIAILFNLLANRYIRKDEKLVRSVDRLR